MLRKYVLAGIPYHESFAFMADGVAEAAAFKALIEYTQQALVAENVEIKTLPSDPRDSMKAFLLRLGAERGKKIQAGKLEQAWESWERRYRDAEKNNPALELHDKLSWISEGHEGSTWPRGREEILRKWVESGANPSDFPLDDRYDLLNPQFCKRLLYLRNVLGGWMYEDDAGNIELR